MTASASCLYPALHLGRIILQYLIMVLSEQRILRMFARGRIPATGSILGTSSAADLEDACE